MSHEILGAGSLLNAPESALLNEAETEVIFALDGEHYYYDRRPADATNEYMQQRRTFIGPAADITHPEFGRPNLPAENFTITYRIREIPKLKEVVTIDGDKIYEPVHCHQVTEYVVDHQNNLVDTQQF